MDDAQKNDRGLDLSSKQPNVIDLENSTIGHVLHETAKKFPDRDAVIFRNPPSRRTWSEFDREVDRVARALLALGLRHGDHFGVWATNVSEWVLLQFATARIGIVLVTINPSYRPTELAFTLGQSDIKGLALIDQFKSTDYFASLQEVFPELATQPPGSLSSQQFPKLKWVIAIRGPAPKGSLSWSTFLNQADSISIEQLNIAEAIPKCTDPINIQYTSGTTGAPKGAMLSHRNILLNSYYAGLSQHFDERDRLCIPVPLYHCFGCVLGTLCSAVHGVTMVFPSEGLQAGATLEAIELEGCTAVYGVPTMFISMLEHADFSQRNLKTLRTGIMAGSPCPIEVMKRVTSDMGAHQMTIGYGQTEAS
ncbi:MAG: AMP-binding protein, partial [Planctomycetes bacterium]|nr:AMP-binding protein [Planctomycetota bacterium]